MWILFLYLFIGTEECNKCKREAKVDLGLKQTKNIALHQIIIFPCFAEQVR